MNPEMVFSAAEAIAGTRGTAPAEAVTNQAADTAGHHRRDSRRKDHQW